jgi:predicted dehydrogenase
MKTLIVGLGSMGKRRIRLLKGLYPDAEILGVDTNPRRRRQVEEMGCKTFENIARAAEKQPDAAFVCTAPLAHYKIIMELLSYGINTFTELNLVSDGYGEMMEKAKEKNAVLFLSSTMLYRGEIQYMAKRVKDFKKDVSYIYHIGQYLPDWHPWEDYRDFFVSNKRTNGCRELFAIELPWIIDTFGKITDVYSVADKMTGLQLDFPDRFFTTITHENGTRGVLAIDLVCPKPVRNLEIFGEGLHIFWEGNPKSLYDYDIEKKEKVFINTYESFEHDSRYSDNIVENAYVDEMQNFFGVISGKEQPRYSYEKDLFTIDIMDKIEGVKK